LKTRFAHLVVTKYRSPPLKAGWIERPSLVQCLDAALDSGRRLALLSAPAGYGKTTLLAQWTARRGQCQPDAGAISVDAPASPATVFAWLTLDGGDNDPLRFLTYLVAALQQASPVSCAATASLLPAGDVRALLLLLPALANDPTPWKCSAGRWLWPHPKAASVCLWTKVRRWSSCWKFADELRRAPPTFRLSRNFCAPMLVLLKQP
jgi:ATP/maltotriose-dependent transcriptional regulator MalT